MNGVYLDGVSDSNGELIGLAKYFIKIPKDVILHKDHKVLLTYIFFSSKQNRWGEIDLSIDSLIKWCGFKPNRNNGKTNDAFISAINELIRMKYINSPDNDHLQKDAAANFTVYFDNSYVDKRIEKIKTTSDNEGLFATMYFDEMNLIREYSKVAGGINTAILFKTLIYLRSMIYMRNETYAKNYVEAYYDNYKNICNRLNVSKNTFIKYIQILKDELNLIYYQSVKKIGTDKSINTITTIFVNTYCRQKGKLQRYGKSYYLQELQKKKKEMGLGGEVDDRRIQ